jgi:formimidoylglutamate deiminase
MERIISLQSLFFVRAWVDGRWESAVRIEISKGCISKLSLGAEPLPADERHWVGLPGMCNTHSHAFQRGMAGWTEVRGTTDDSFWTWRECMYHFLETLTPEDVRAIASQCYLEMLEAGFTRVGEFHYLHHDIDGKPYSKIGEMASSIFAAAESTGIGLTMLPSFYAHSDFGGQEPTAGQRRFICNLDQFCRIVDHVRSLAEAADQGRVAGDTNIGIAPHSLRAVTQEELQQLVRLFPGIPIHMHIAEQQREVAVCVERYGKSPVEWLFDHFQVDANWCLIHATHATSRELEAIAHSAATVCLCPITEANLGDGIFPAANYISQGGKFAVGSDSNIELSVASELKQLEYSQRLRDQRRNVLATSGQSTGEGLFRAAEVGGTQALGRTQTGIKIGAAADLVSLDQNHPTLQNSPSVMDGWIFSAGNSAIDCVWRLGKKVVHQGRHVARDPIARDFAKAMRRLRKT